MATQPPPPPPPPAPGQPAYNPAPPAAPAKRRRGCGCGGCLVVLLLVLALVAAGIYFFAIVPASAGVGAPATLTVYVPKVDVAAGGGAFAAGHTGQALNGGSTVRTDDGGRASLGYPDGSITRVAGGTTLTLTQENLDSHGGMHNAVLDQEVGRTYHTVQALTSGGQFRVEGHGVTADVRGTEFEVYTKPDHSGLIKLFKGRLHVAGKGAVDLTANQQVAIATDSTVGTPAPIAPDPADPFAIWVGPGGSESNAATGNQPGSVQTAASAAPIAAAGQSADTAAYQFPGGDLTAVLSYPGSLMHLDVIGPAGQVVGSGEGPPPVRVTVPGLPPGVYKGRVTGLVLDHGPEPWSVSFASNPPCTQAAPPQTVAAGQPVRATLSASAVNAALAQSGVGSVISISPSAGGAIVTGSLANMGVNFAVTAVIYATPPTVGVTLTSASLNGINVTSAVSAQATQLTGSTLQALNIGFAVDRVYSCKAADGGLLIIEGHGQ